MALHLLYNSLSSSVKHNLNSFDFVFDYFFYLKNKNNKKVKTKQNKKDNVQWPNSAWPCLENPKHNGYIFNFGFTSSFSSLIVSAVINKVNDSKIPRDS